jgi:hypothetical protein
MYEYVCLLLNVSSKLRDPMTHFVDVIPLQQHLPPISLICNNNRLRTTKWQGKLSATNSTQLNSSREEASWAATQELPRIVCVQNSPPPVPIVSHVNPVHITPFSLSKIHLKQGYWKNRPSQQLFKVFIYIYFAATCFGPVWSSSGGIHNYFQEVTSLQRIRCFVSQVLFCICFGKYCRRLSNM